MRSFARAFGYGSGGRGQPPTCRATTAACLCLAFLSIGFAPSGLHAATIYGSVADEGQKPIRRVTLTLHTAGAAPQAVGLQSTTSDEEGLFRFDDVQPGSYVITAEKKRWVTTEKRVFISDEDAEGELAVDVMMRLTPLWRMLGSLQVGLLVYVALFGLVVLAANMWIVPVPSREVSVIGWAFVVGSVLIACVKLMWVEALILTALGGVLGGLIHRFGGKAAARRVGQLEQERQQQTAKEKERHDRLAALVGKQGVTVTDLKACGSASLEGEIVEVRAFDGFIPKGAPIVVKSLQGKTPVVERRQPSDAIADRPRQGD
jgi:hypothetical protein